MAEKFTRKQIAEIELLSRGAGRETKKTHDGETKSGWWMDTIWLAPRNMPELALEALDG